ncbi:hypothetical protein GCM10023231_12670 [Olivibacter ginsenosidimutans]|uniref:Uncharacterized protein n=1 Tax=Olivibacter ginsenosidimutans TaxID=1176537 RepID=A0ABP9AX76_9SPHI
MYGTCADRENPDASMIGARSRHDQLPINGGKKGEFDWLFAFLFFCGGRKETKEDAQLQMS